MTWLAIAAIALWVAFLLLYRYAGRPGAPDDFASGILAFFVGVVALVVTLGYLGAVLYTHRFV